MNSLVEGGRNEEGKFPKNGHCVSNMGRIYNSAFKIKQIKNLNKIKRTRAGYYGSRHLLIPALRRLKQENPKAWAPY